MRQATTRIVKAGGCPVIVALWQNTGGSSQVSWVRFLATAGLSLSSIFTSKTSNLLLFQLKARVLSIGRKEWPNSMLTLGASLANHCHYNAFFNVTILSCFACINRHVNLEMFSIAVRKCLLSLKHRNAYPQMIQFMPPSQYVVSTARTAHLYTCIPCTSLW